MTQNNFDDTYHGLLNNILTNGIDKGDRTGTGTRSVFGAQAKFDLREGFPLLTTKKVYTKSIIHELLWFIAGDTNIGYLLDNNVNIWNEWADANGDVHDSYSKQLIRFEATAPNWSIQPKLEPQVAKVSNLPKPKPTLAGVGYYGEAHSQLTWTPEKLNRVKKLWKGIINRCYAKKASNYKFYGAKGVTVHPDWHNLHTFCKDISRLPGYENWLNKRGNYELDKDYYGTKEYSISTCVFLPKKINVQLQGKPISYGDEVFPTVKDVADRFNVSRATIRNWLNLRTTPKHPLKYNLEYLHIPEGYMLRPEIYKNQLVEAVQLIKSDPNSRRNVITLWNPSDMHRAVLANCHGSVIQFSVNAGSLDLAMYQRSCDTLLGVPFNIASYALLLEMVAQVTGLKAGMFTHTYGDLHIYNNHKEQVAEQLTRTSFAPPTLKLNPEIKNIEDFRYEDIIIENYKHHAPIKAEISV